MQCPPRVLSLFLEALPILHALFRSSTRSKKDSTTELPQNFPCLTSCVAFCCPGPIWPKSLSRCRMRAWMLGTLGFFPRPFRDSWWGPGEMTPGVCSRLMVLFSSCFGFTIFHVVSRESPLRASRCYKDGALIHKASLQDLSLEDYYMLIYDFQLDNYPSKASSKLIWIWRYWL